MTCTYMYIYTHCIYKYTYTREHECMNVKIHRHNNEQKKYLRDGKTANILKNQGERRQNTERSDTQSMLDAKILMHPDSDQCVQPQARFSDSRPQSQKEFRFL